MIIRHSLQLLEQLTEVEDKIRVLEQFIEELNLVVDKDNLIATILARKYLLPPDQ